MAVFTALKGGPLWAATLIVVAVIGAATALAWQGTLSGSDFLAIITPILAGVVGVASAHVAGQTAAAAINVTPGSPASVVAAPTVEEAPGAATAPAG